MTGNRKKVHLAYFLIDVLFISASFFLAYCLRYGSGCFVLSYDMPYIADHGLLFLIWGMFLVFFLNVNGLYSTNRALSIPREIARVLKSVFFASVLAGLVIFLLQFKAFSRFVFVLAAVLLCVSLSSWRALKKIALRKRFAAGKYNTNVLIVGAGRAGRALLHEIDRHPYMGMHVVGFLDDEKSGHVDGREVLGTLDELDETAARFFVDEVYVTIPSARERVASVISSCKKANRAVRVLADSFELLYSSKKDKGEKLSSFVLGLPVNQVRLDHIGIIPLISYMDAGPHGTEMFVKRALDIVLAFFGVLVFSPVMALVAIAIKLDSPGPVIYSSERCGRKGRPFKFYKFRSMVKDAEMRKKELLASSEVDGPAFKMKQDPRLTRVGAFLRRYSLDELPQLFNVLKGDMSLVGPRPPLPEEVAGYDLWQMRRLDVRPGLTCLWQVRGRSDLSFYKWIKWDLWYIDNWSLFLDVRILFWTLPAVFRKKGAY